MKLKGVLFDNDGTLVDTRELIMESFAYAAHEVLGRAVTPEEVLATGGKPLVTQMEMLSGNAQTAQELARVYRDHNHAIHDERISLFGGVKEGLERLRSAGLRMGVVTSKMHWLAWHGLEICGIAEYFGCCIGADDSPAHKPDPQPVLMGADALGLDASSCVYVGDSAFDIRAGNAAGCTSAAALWGMFAEDELLAERPDLTARSFTDLVDQLLSL